MKLLNSFKPKLFAAMLFGCAAVAGVASWLTGLNFWVLVGFLVVGVLINGLVATVEDRDAKKPEK